MEKPGGIVLRAFFVQNIVIPITPCYPPPPSLPLVIAIRVKNRQQIRQHRQQMRRNMEIINNLSAYFSVARGTRWGGGPAPAGCMYVPCPRGSEATTLPVCMYVAPPLT